MTEAEKLEDIKKNSDVAAFAYFLILSPVLLFTRKDSPFIQFHARQAVTLFVFFIIIAMLPKPYSWANLLAVALALTGVIQANMGNEWRMPVVAGMLESGLSLQAMEQFFKRILSVLRRVFSSPESASKAASAAVAKIRRIDPAAMRDELVQIQQTVTDSRERIAFLEEVILMESLLREKQLEELSTSSRKQVSKLREQLSELLPEDHTEIESGHAIRLFGNGKKILIGAFSDESSTVYVSGVATGSTLKFGDFSGYEIDLRDEDQAEQTIEKLREIVTATAELSKE